MGCEYCKRDVCIRDAGKIITNIANLKNRDEYSEGIYKKCKNSIKNDSILEIPNYIKNLPIKEVFLGLASRYDIYE